MRASAVAPSHPVTGLGKEDGEKVGGVPPAGSYLQCASERMCCRPLLLVVGVGLLFGSVDGQTDVNAFAPAVQGGCINGHNQGGSCELVLVLVLVLFSFSFSFLIHFVSSLLLTLLP